MIKEEILVDTIHKFFVRLKELSEKIDKNENSGEAAMEYYKMTKAWSKLDNVVEYEILPYTENNE